MQNSSHFPVVSLYLSMEKLQKSFCACSQILIFMMNRVIGSLQRFPFYRTRTDFPFLQCIFDKPFRKDGDTDANGDCPDECVGASAFPYWIKNQMMRSEDAFNKVSSCASFFTHQKRICCNILQHDFGMHQKRMHRRGDQNQVIRCKGR